MTAEADNARALHALAEDLRRAPRVLVITGAGMSADSGLATYRGFGGLYDGEITEDGVTIEQALSGHMLRTRPEVCWKYLGEIERSARGRQPHAGHHALVKLATRFERFTVLMQNVDGFHERAGQEDVIEMHGSLDRLHCLSCPHELRVSDYAGLKLPPICPECAGPMRPNVVLFGESLPLPALEKLDEMLGEGVDFVLSIGTTSIFPYIAGPVEQAARLGLPTAEINPDQSEVSHLVRHRVRDRAEPVLTRLLEYLK